MFANGVSGKRVSSFLQLQNWYELVWGRNSEGTPNDSAVPGLIITINSALLLDVGILSKITINEFGWSCTLHSTFCPHIEMQVWLLKPKAQVGRWGS